MLQKSFSRLHFVVKESLDHCGGAGVLNTKTTTPRYSCSISEMAQPSGPSLNMTVGTMTNA